MHLQQMPKSFSYKPLKSLNIYNSLPSVIPAYIAWDLTNVINDMTFQPDILSRPRKWKPVIIAGNPLL